MLQRTRHALGSAIALMLFSLTLSQVHLWPCKSAQASEPTLTLRHSKKAQTFTQTQLLKRSDLEKLVLRDTPTHPHQAIEFTAVPVSRLFASEKLSEGSTILFRCQDGFSAPIDKNRLLNEDQNQATAYLAIEDPKHPWPKIAVGKNRVSPGPFYVIWKNAQASRIQTEEWPYQVIEFEIRPSLKESYPKLFPPTILPAEHQVMRGLRIFTQNCFTCHTMNLQGDSNFGPDLNLPHSPIEYLQEPYLKKFIRNPQEVRHWREDRMKGFSTAEISDQELSDVIEYLKEMAKTRPSLKNNESKGSAH